MTEPTFRFTLRSLFAVVTVAAIGSAALANPTDLWASVVFSGTLGLLVVALLVAVARRGAGAIGFAICGCAYLGLILVPGAETNIVPNLVTSKVITKAEPPLSGVDLLNLALLNFHSGYTTGTKFTPPATPFQRIGHSLFALLFAIVGSVVARWLYRGNDESEEKLTPPEAPPAILNAAHQASRCEGRLASTVSSPRWQ